VKSPVELLASYRRVRLQDYLIEQRCGVDRDKQIAIFSKVYSGELTAFTTLPPALPPTDVNMRSVLRYAMNEVNHEREVPALSNRKIKDEIGKAAAGRDADWQVLDNLILLVPTAASLPHTPAKAVQREPAHKENILAAIRELGYDPIRLPRPDGNDGVKKEVKIHVGNAIPDGAFKKAWQALRDERSIQED